MIPTMLTTKLNLVTYIVFIIWGFGKLGNCLLGTDEIMRWEEPDACDILTKLPKECRANQSCIFSCSSRTCISKVSDKKDTCKSNQLILDNPMTHEQQKRLVCPELCHDVCNCRRNRCQYDVTDSSCRPIPSNNECQPGLFHKEDCIRPNTIYIDAGLTCNNSASSLKTKCEIVETIIAVNINGDTVKDEVTGITYIADAVATWFDPYGTRIAETTTEKISGTPKAMEKLWTTYIRGDGRVARDGRCVSYTIPIRSEGKYELIIKLAEYQYNQPNQRNFRIKFNKMDILLEEDLFQDIGAKNYGVDFVLKFTVSHRIVLFPNGFKQSVIQNGQTELAFCYGSSECGFPDRSYLVSGFAVVRYNGKGNIKLAAGTLFATCDGWSYTTCMCKLKNCEYNTVTLQCEDREDSCTQMELDETTCRKAGTFMAHGGIICPTDKAAGNCNRKRVIFSLNVNGKKYTDISEGITYEADDNPARYEDPQGSRVGLNTPIPSSGPCFSTDADFKDTAALYYTAAIGMKKKNDRRICLNYLVPLDMVEGRYLLTIKTMDFKHVGEVRRFNIKLNGVIVVPELDIVQVNGRCKKVDLLINFHIVDGGSKMLIDGHPAIKIASDKNDCKHTARVGFCYSSCPNIDHGYLVGAISVVELESAGELTVAGAGSATSPVVPKSMCDKIKVGVTHSKFECYCHQARCEFSLDKKICGNTELLCPQVLQNNNCQRKDDFYVEDGVVCQMQRDDGCKLEKPIIAINVNGEAVTDRNGISYTAEKPSDYVYTYHSERRTESFADTRDACLHQELNPEATEKDPNLYFTLVHGWSSDYLRKPNNCLHYPIRITQDGKYELGLKFLESYHEFFNSYFTVKLNNQTILSRFDMVFHFNENCLPVDVYLQFEVLGCSSTLQIIGHKKYSKILDNTINLSFCYGDVTTDCIKEANTITKDEDDEDDVGDPNYSISGFYVARYKDLNSPKTEFIR